MFKVYPKKYVKPRTYEQGTQEVPEMDEADRNDVIISKIGLKAFLKNLIAQYSREDNLKWYLSI